MNFKDVWEGFVALLMILFVLSIPIAIVALGGMAFGIYPTETTYSYEVKAQQVFDGDRVEDSDVTEMEDLSSDEQKLLYDAFKKTDHFMGSEEVTLSYQDERLETFTDWRTVESNGVLLLVAINEQPEDSPDHSEYTWFHWLLMGGLLYCCAGWLFLLLLPPV